MGPSAESEPETKNAVCVFDTYPHIQYFVDLHSFSEDICTTGVMTRIRAVIPT
ncbi:hypothetical protein [Paraburkholderia strydomiana]|uniref:hypothetical protein n=1 Tax=Paraburkholderia strydomiana TaxID=1245417 RepID=UPI0038B7B79B